MKEIIVALVTPFNENGNINFAILDVMIEKNLEQGASGFFVGGSAGEGMLLTLDERLSLFSYLSKYTDNIKVFANVSSLSVKEAVLLAKKAKKYGYYAMSSVIPYYYRHSMKSIAAYYTSIMETVDLQMLIYNFPLNSGVDFDLEDLDIIQLFKHKSVIGIKHTNRDLYQMEKIIRINPNLKIYNGYDETFLNSLPFNIDGAIGSTFNITLPLFVKIAELYEKGEVEQAFDVQKRANMIMDELIRVGLIPGIKHAMKYLGIDVGLPRLPFLDITDSHKKELEKVIDRLICSC